MVFDLVIKNCRVTRIDSCTYLVRRAHQLLAMKREEKAQEEAEKAKQGEVERRKVGQDMARLKQWKEERERKEFENSYKKQKEEDRLAREKVRADLERDRSVTMWNSYVNISNEASKMFMSLLNFFFTFIPAVFLLLCPQ